MIFEKYLAGLKKSIDNKLDKCLPKESEEPRAVHSAMRYSVFSGGKRIRPVIILESCKVCGGRVSDSLACACAVELIHTYSLIHDDLPSMDNDDYRRGKPTCHRAFGEATAILAGDALMPLAFNIIAGGYQPAIASRIIEELSGAIGTKGMVAGQALDMDLKSDRINKDAIRRANYLKTAKLFEVSAKIGAIASGTGVKKIKAMAAYGLNLGVAFQLIDDIIDADGSAQTRGHSTTEKDAVKAIGKAKNALAIFGKRADVLKAIAESVLTRKRDGADIKFNK